MTRFTIARRLAAVLMAFVLAMVGIAQVDKAQGKTITVLWEHAGGNLTNNEVSYTSTYHSFEAPFTAVVIAYCDKSKPDYYVAANWRKSDGNYWWMVVSHGYDYTKDATHNQTLHVELSSLACEWTLRVFRP